MYAIHPLTVHFPVALLLTSSLFTLLYLRGRQQSFEISGYYCLVVGWLASLLSLLTGTIDAVRQVVGSDAPHRDAIQWVNAHAGISMLIVVVFGQALLRRRRDPALLDDPVGRVAYLRLLALGSVLIVIGGWLGGYLVYTLGLGVQGS